MEPTLHLTVALVSSLFSCSDASSNSTSTDDGLFENLATRAVIIGIFVLAAGGFSLFAFCFFGAHDRCRKRKIQNAPPDAVVSLPTWSRSVRMDVALQNSGFREMSDGIRHYGSTNRIIRHRSGQTPTDGARWSVGLSSGKHVFEIIWPWGGRGYQATVGVSTWKQPINMKGGPVSLVGATEYSWGLDIVRRQVMHNKKKIKNCPTDGSYVPDRFFMFVDLDIGQIGYGTDFKFWGYVLYNLPLGGSEKYYVMVGSSKYQSDIQVYYRGTACSGGFDPFAPTGAQAALATTGLMQPPGSSPLAPPTLGPIPPPYPADKRQQASAPSVNEMYDVPPPAYEYHQPQTVSTGQSDVAPYGPPVPQPPQQSYGGYGQPMQPDQASSYGYGQPPYPPQRPYPPQ